MKLNNSKEFIKVSSVHHMLTYNKVIYIS